MHCYRNTLFVELPELPKHFFIICMMRRYSRLKATCHVYQSTMLVSELAGQYGVEWGDISTSGATVHKNHGSVGTLVLKSHFGMFLVQQG